MTTVPGAAPGMTWRVPGGEKTRDRIKRLRYLARTQWAPRARMSTRASVRHLQDNAYTICGLICFDAAGFTHSVFTGLIVTGASWFALELKSRGA